MFIFYILVFFGGGGALQPKVARSPISEVSTSFTHTWHNSACGRGYYLHDTQQTQKTNIHGLNRIQTSNPSKPAILANQQLQT